MYIDSIDIMECSTPEYTIEYTDFGELEMMLSKITLPHNTERFKGIERGKNRNLTFGLIKNRITKKIELSVASKKFGSIFDILVDIGDEICPFKYTTIHVNKNVVCPRHKDSLMNRSPSIIISFGEYLGAKLMIEEGEETKEYDCRHRALLFDGRKFFHYNTPLLGGTKYSLVFFNVVEEGETKYEERIYENGGTDIETKECTPQEFCGGERKEDARIGCEDIGGSGVDKSEESTPCIGTCRPRTCRPRTGTTLRTARKSTAKKEGNSDSAVGK
jgi:hypothetical protein